ncbi:apolipoprotein D-like [Onthophagus taurus]|uniref:apolipoprotein D-like n=1 Tax=Onthophagus taurus TaxID=166361 RepID=UPI0039BE3499
MDFFSREQLYPTKSQQRKMSTLSLFVFLTVCVIVNAQIPGLGFCPDYTPMDNFDMNRFLGKWYEAERYFTFTDVASRCVVTDYAQTATGRIYVSSEYTNRLTGVKRVINGNVQQTGREGQGRIQVKYQQPITTETNLVVLDTDYDSYAVVWSCSGLGPVHAENAWLLTRERLPSAQVLQRAYGVLDKFRINRTFFIKTQQEGCPLAASDINAAQGITSISTLVEQTGDEKRQNPKKKETAQLIQEEEEEEVDEDADDGEVTASIETRKESVKNAVKDIVAGAAAENLVKTE